MENGVSWYLYFKPDPHVRTLELEHRPSATREHFQACLKQISPLPKGVRLLTTNDLMLSVTLVGPEKECLWLADHVEKEALGRMIRNERVGIAAGIKSP
jgi:hypothetical protein